jgi:hypothetical protein
MIKNFPNIKKPSTWRPNDSNPEYWKALERADKQPSAKELWNWTSTSSGIPFPKNPPLKVKPIIED